MRLKDLRIENFRTFDHAHLTFGTHLTYLGGPNDVGKSGVLDAIQWALTGRCRGIAGHGAGVGTLSRGGPMAVALVLETGDHRRLTVQRRWRDAAVQVHVGRAGDDLALLPTKVGTDALLGVLGASEAILSALSQTGAFLNLDHKDAKDLLLRVLNVQVPVYGASEAPPTDGVPSPTIAYEDALQRYDSAFQTRRDLKPVIKQLELAIPADLDLTEAPPNVAELEQALADLRTDLVSLEHDQSMTAGESRGQRTALEQQRTVAVQTADAAKTALAGIANRAKDLRDKEAASAALNEEGRIDRKHLAIDAARTRVTALDLDLARLTGTLQALESQGGKRTCVVSDTIACPVEASVFSKEVAAVKKAIKAGTSLRDVEAKDLAGLEATQARRTARADQMTALAREMGPLLAHEQRRQSASTEVAVMAKRVTDLQAELEALPAEDVRTSTENPAIPALRDRIRKGEQTIQAARDLEGHLLRAQDAQARLTKIREALQEAEALVAWYGPTGAPARALGEALTAFAAAINAALQWWGYQVTFRAEPWTVEVNGRDLAILATSLRHRIGIAFQLALADVTGVKVVLIDEADLLDEDGRGQLMELVDRWDGQVLIAGTRSDAFTPGGDAADRIYRLERDIAGGGATVILGADDV
jgi:exonuclease SbcC